MKNKQHKYILKAFIKSKIPNVILVNCPDLIAIDSILGGYCTQLLNKAKFIELPTIEIISKTDKEIFSRLINQSTGVEKDELLIYYRLAILVEAILKQYKKTTVDS